MEDAAYAAKDGLSPLARGTQSGPASTRHRSRFIPAGAGNTLQTTTVASPAAVYPRWRGEHTTRKKEPFAFGGLSPLARGTRESFTGRYIPCGFIPAGAGNTHWMVSATWLTPVYPRWRGEHFALVLSLPPIIGLSPLARGTHGLRQVVVSKRRFIPAGAGNTG